MSNFSSIVALSFASVLVGCAGSGGGRTADVVLKPTQGQAAHGSVSFRQDGDLVLLTARITGLTPGAHGFHIHERGDCSAPDATSAGGHFNPTGKAHGSPDQAEHHGGDMPQLVADASGNATLKASLQGISLESGVNSIVGRGVIVHAAPDDFKTQPTGNSGARLACGVIVLN